MDGESTLKRIIEEEGSCCWSKPSICANCPMSKLKQKKNGSWMSCIEALGVEDMTEEQADARYKEIAIRMLLDETIDNLLRDDNGTQ